MTEAQALAVLSGLRAAFPRQRFDREAAQVYATQILDLDAEICMRAVQSLIRTSTWFPTIAEIREEFKRFWESRERPPALEMAKPTAEERERLARLMRGWVTDRFGGITETERKELPAAKPGRCDDCAEQSRSRWLYGRFVLCGYCVSLRTQAAARLLA